MAKDWATGEVLTAADLDRYANNSRTPRVKVKRTADQTGMASATDYLVTWQTAEYEVVGDVGTDMWDSVTNPSRIIAPRAGDYLIHCQITWNNFGGSGQGTYQVNVVKNSAGTLNQSNWVVNQVVTAAAGFIRVLTASGTARLAANDYLEAFVYHNHGVTGSISNTAPGCFLSLTLIGDS